MRALLVSPLGLLIGLALGALGAGGSILAVPVLVYAAGQAPQQATTTSLVLVGVAAVVGSVRHHRAGRVRPRIATALALAGIPGSLVGNAVNGGIDPDLLLLAFSGLVLVAAWRMAVGCPACTRAGEQESVVDEHDAPPARQAAGGVRRAFLALGVGVGVGFLTGLFGVGGGFVIVPAATLLLGLGMAEAIGTALVVVAFNCGVSLLARLSTSHIDWGVTLPFVIAAVVGVIVGERIADRLDQRLLQRVFAGVLVAVAIAVAGGAVVALV